MQKKSRREQYKKSPPRALSLKGGVNPATPYSPGPEGQVPSAKRGLTSVFGMGTGVTLAQEPLKQVLGSEMKTVEKLARVYRSTHGSGLLTQRELKR